MGRTKHAINFEGQVCQPVRFNLLTRCCGLLTNSNRTCSKKAGVFWSKDYNRMMDRCVGYQTNLDTMARGLPCMPASVVYGHTASRNLDINRWSFGLDTGCVGHIHVPRACWRSLTIHYSGLRSKVDCVGARPSSSSHFPCTTRGRRPRRGRGRSGGRRNPFTRFC